MMKRKAKKGLVICKIAAAIAVGVFTIFMSARFTQADEPFINPEYLQEYHQVHKIREYTFTLTHGLYSEKTRTGCCIIEVEKDNGPMVMPDVVWDGERIDVFNDYGNDKSISLYPINGGTLNIRAKIKGDKMIAYVDFENSPKQPEATEEYYNNQFYLDCIDYSTETLERDYSFRLEDNAGGKEYQIGESTKLSISYLGLSVESDCKMKDLTVELKDGKNKTKKFDFISYKADIAGHYSENTQEDGGYRKYTYLYTFNKINYDIFDWVKEIYVNGKKITN